MNETEILTASGTKLAAAIRKKKVSSEEVVRLAVKRMLRRGPLGNKQLTKLKCFKAEHNHQAQSPKEIDLKNGKQIAEVIYDI